MEFRPSTQGAEQSKLDQVRAASVCAVVAVEALKVVRRARRDKSKEGLYEKTQNNSFSAVGVGEPTNVGVNC